MTEPVTAPHPAKPREVVDGFMKAFAGDRMDELLALCSPDVILKVYGAPEVPWIGSGLRHGREGVRAYVDTLKPRLIPLTFSTVLTLDGGEGHVVLFGSYAWLVKNNERRFSGDWAFLFAVKDGLITYISMYEDTYALAQAVLDLPGKTLAQAAGTPEHAAPVEQAHAGDLHHG